ncbi:hypothetical protein [Spirosoma arcticum]
MRCTVVHVGGVDEIAVRIDAVIEDGLGGIVSGSPAVGAKVIAPSARGLTIRPERPRVR